MKKEVIIAIVIGLAMGLVITFGFYRVKNSTSQPPVTDLDEEVATTSASSDVLSTISIHSPEDEIVQSSGKIQVTGTTTESSIIVLTYDEESIISESDESGNFSFDVTLPEGPHILVISVLEDSGEITSEERTIVISDIFDQENEETEQEKEDENNDKETSNE